MKPSSLGAIADELAYITRRLTVLSEQLTEIAAREAADFCCATYLDRPRHR